MRVPWLVGSLMLGGCPYISDSDHEARLDALGEAADSEAGADSDAETDSDITADSDASADSDSDAADTDESVDTDPPLVVCYEDNDRDGVGKTGGSTTMSGADGICPDLFAPAVGDCDDGEPFRHPGLDEGSHCDKVDVDCSSDPVCRREDWLTGDVPGLVSVYALGEGRGVAVAGGYADGDIYADVAAAAPDSDGSLAWSIFADTDEEEFSTPTYGLILLQKKVHFEVIPFQPTAQPFGAFAYADAVSVQAFPFNKNLLVFNEGLDWNGIAPAGTGVVAPVGPVTFVPTADRSASRLAAAFHLDPRAGASAFVASRGVMVSQRIHNEGPGDSVGHAWIWPSDSTEPDTFGRSLLAARTAAGHGLVIGAEADGANVLDVVLTDDLAGGENLTAVRYARGSAPLFGTSLIACDLDGDDRDEIVTLVERGGTTGGLDVVALPSIDIEREVSLDASVDYVKRMRVPRADDGSPPTIGCADYDGNGAGDILIGHGSLESSADGAAGVVWVFLGRVGRLPRFEGTTDERTLGIAAADATWWGTAEYPLGGAVAGMPDRNGDGVDEIVVGLPDAEWTEGAMATIKGGVAILWGRSFQ